MNRLTFAVGVLLAAGLCYAPIIDKPSGSQFHGELSNSELNKVQGQASGQVLSGDNLEGSSSQQQGALSSDSKASTMLGSLQSDKNAIKTLKNASEEQTAKPVPNPARFLLVATMFLALGGGIAYGVRLYLDKSVPEAPVGRSKKS